MTAEIQSKPALQVSEATAGYVAQLALRDPVLVAFLENHLRDAHGVILEQGQRVVFRFDITAKIIEDSQGGPA